MILTQNVSQCSKGFFSTLRLRPLRISSPPRTGLKGRIVLSGFRCTEFLWRVERLC